MVNTPDFYMEIGRKAARANRQGDEGRSKHYNDLFTQAKQNESAFDKRQADILFKEAYSGFRFS